MVSREGSLYKTTCCSCRGPRFYSPWTLSFITISYELYIHTYVQPKYSHIKKTNKHLKHIGCTPTWGHKVLHRAGPLQIEGHMGTWRSWRLYSNHLLQDLQYSVKRKKKSYLKSKDILILSHSSSVTWKFYSMLVQSRTLGLLLLSSPESINFLGIRKQQQPLISSQCSYLTSTFERLAPSKRLLSGLLTLKKVGQWLKLSLHSQTYLGFAYIANGSKLLHKGFPTLNGFMMHPPHCGLFS